MKNKLPILAGVVFAAIFAFNVSPAHATVGGPTYIYDVRTTALTQKDASEIMYVERSSSGRGCPPEIFALDIQTNKTRKLTDCNDSIDPVIYDAKFNSVLADYPTLLSRIDLKKNSIQAVVKVIREVKIDEEREIYFGQTDFSLDVYQNGIKKTTLTYPGCTPTQPHVIEGYVVPGGNFIALLLSTKGDCFEGGYIMERLYIVPNITIHDSTALPIRKNGTPAVADAEGTNGNLLVSLGKPSEVTPPTPAPDPAPVPVPSPSESNNSIPVYYIIIGLLILIILLLVFRVKKNWRF